MRDNAGTIIFLGILAVAAIAVEFGLVSGGVYDVIRIVLLVGIAIVAIVAIVIVVFLVKAGSSVGNARATGRESNATVRSSSSLEARGIRYRQQEQVKSAAQKDDVFSAAEKASDYRPRNAAESDDDAIRSAIDESDKTAEALRSATEDLR